VATDTKYTAALQRTRSFGPSGNSKIHGTIEKYIVKVAPEAVTDAVRAISAYEMTEQIQLDNPPSAVAVDNKDARIVDIPRAIHRVQMNFANVEMMILAAREAFDLLQRVTRLQSPAKNQIVARQNYMLKIGTAAYGLLPGAFSVLKASRLDSRSVVRIVGPTVNYGRRMYWNPVGASRSTFLKAKESATGPRLVYSNKYAPRWKPYSSKYLRRVVREAYGPGKKAADALGRLQKSKPRPGRSEGTTQIVKRLLRARPEYKQLTITDAWISYPPAGRWGRSSRDDRVPTISIKLKRGRGNFASRLGG